MQYICLECYFYVIDSGDNVFNGTDFMDSVVDIPVRQAGIDHNIEFLAMVTAIHLLHICLQK